MDLLVELFDAGEGRDLPKKGTADDILGRGGGGRVESVDEGTGDVMPEERHTSDRGGVGQEREGGKSNTGSGGICPAFGKDRRDNQAGGWGRFVFIPLRKAVTIGIV